MNRMYLPYPIETFVKIVSWFAIITIDLIEFLLAPFMRIGVKCFAAFAIAATLFSGYVYFSYELMINQAFSIFSTLIITFLMFIGFVHLIKYVLRKVIRPPFANIVFAPVAVSFRRPYSYKKAKLC
ncbi:MAG: hypothetical protein IJZ42_01570 [Lachnospiraceae bacterium]|nr:hypothetical protein [Lachnospiraceae bacterium]